MDYNSVKQAETAWAPSHVVAGLWVRRLTLAAWLSATLCDCLLRRAWKDVSCGVNAVAVVRHEERSGVR